MNNDTQKHVQCKLTWLFLKFCNDRSIYIYCQWKNRLSNHLSPLDLFGCHDDDPCVFLPDHSPEIGQSSRETTLCSYKTFLVGICWWVFVHLIIIFKKNNDNNDMLISLHLFPFFLLPLTSNRNRISMSKQLSHRLINLPWHLHGNSFLPWSICYHQKHCIYYRYTTNLSDGT